VLDIKNADVATHPGKQLSNFVSRHRHWNISGERDEVLLGIRCLRGSLLAGRSGVGWRFRLRHGLFFRVNAAFLITGTFICPSLAAHFAWLIGFLLSKSMWNIQDDAKLASRLVARTVTAYRRCCPGTAQRSDHLL
jgi:hypothetical protein